jgi:DNA-binding CsgD family transcriptional regulator
VRPANQGEPVSGRLERVQCPRQFRQYLEQIPDEAIVGDLEDRRLLVLVDRYDHLGLLHARQMLNGARDPDGDVQLRRDHLARLADLIVVWDEARELPSAFTRTLTFASTTRLTGTRTFMARCSAIRLEVERTAQEKLLRRFEGLRKIVIPAIAEEEIRVGVQLKTLARMPLGARLAGWRSLHRSDTDHGSNTVKEALSPRERNILELIAEGQSNKEIARTLGVAPETVKSHVKNIFVKLDVEKRAQAVARAQTLGFVRTGS